MKLLTSGEEIRKSFEKGFNKYNEFYCAVAWAGNDEKLIKLLKKNKNKIKKVIIGTYFSRTSPVFIKEFEDYKGIKYIKDTKNLFHPKIYIFKKNKNCMLIIGSANLTSAAFEKNKEVVLLLESKTEKNKEIFEKAFKYIISFWSSASTFSDSELEEYKKMYNKYLKLKKTYFKNFKKINIKKNKKFDIPIIDLPWKDFCKLVFNEKLNGEYVFKKRFEVISVIQKLFLRIKHFNKMSTEQRLAVAGLPTNNNIDYGWFGSMRGNGKFWKQIKINNIKISRALDYIPQKGAVNEEHYKKFIKLFIKSIPNSINPIAIATRLLAMKRPDYFVCVNKKNIKKLGKYFKVTQNITFDRYWEEIVERIQDSKWWNEKNIKSKSEKELYKFRAAFLDSLFYKYK